MAKKQITGGCAFWFKDSPSAWLELGPEKAKTFLEGNQIAKGFLMLIPAPYGQIAYAMAEAKIRDAKKHMGPKGLWVKFNAVKGYSGARARTETNKQKEPSPW